MKHFRGLWRPQALDGSSLDGEDPIAVAWRPLTAKEYRRFQSYAIPPAPDIYETCLIEGPALCQIPFGIARWIARHVMEKNPFSGSYPDIKRAIDLKRKEVQGNYLACARALIAGTFRYSFEEIDEWDSDLFFERLAQAELLVNTPLEPVDPSKPLPAPSKSPHPPRRKP